MILEHSRRSTRRPALAQRMAIANAIIASGSDDEATWLAIMERVTGP